MDDVPDRRRGGTSERLRAALRQAALRHFVADGFERANVASIAAEVGVTERTFYRHFATKDEVLFGDVANRLEWFADAMREQPDDADLLRAVRRSFVSAPIDPRLMVEIARLRAELLSPARIEQVFRDRQGAMARELREILSQRGDDDLAAAVRAEAVAGAVFAALAVWTERPAPHDLRVLGELTRDALELVRPLL